VYKDPAAIPDAAFEQVGRSRPAGPAGPPADPPDAR
jgi:hypothetical protein